MRYLALVLSFVFLTGWTIALPVENNGGGPFGIGLGLANVPGGLLGGQDSHEDANGNEPVDSDETASINELAKGNQPALGGLIDFTGGKSSHEKEGGKGHDDGLGLLGKDAFLNPLTMTTTGGKPLITMPPLRSWTSYHPATTSIFPYDVPPLRLHTAPINGANASTNNGISATMRTGAVKARASATPTLAAGGALESLMSALNINIHEKHKPMFPTTEPEFAPAVQHIIHLVGGRQMRNLPKEIEVSPGHMGAVWATTQALNNMKLDGTMKDKVDIYFTWVRLLDMLILPPLKSDSSVTFTRDELDQYWQNLYEAYYMARVKSAKMSLSTASEIDIKPKGGEIDKSWTMFYTSWEIQGSNLDEVDQLEGHKTNRPGHGLHKKMKQCGAVHSWEFTYGSQQVLDCYEDFVPYGSHTMDKETAKHAKKRRKHAEKEAKKRRKHPDKYPAKELKLTDLGKDIDVVEPLPPEQDFEAMPWWTDIGNSGCRPDWEQAPRPGYYFDKYGQELSYKPQTCQEHLPLDKASCNGPKHWPQDHIVTRNGTDYLHINFYAWVHNAETRVKQLVRDKLREDQGTFTATFTLPVAKAHCVKEKLRSMGWTDDMRVRNKTKMGLFIFDLLFNFAMLGVAAATLGAFTPVQGIVVGAAEGAVGAGANAAAAAIFAGGEEAAAVAAEAGTEAAAGAGARAAGGAAAEAAILVTEDGIVTTPVSEELAAGVVKRVHWPVGGDVSGEAEALAIKTTLADRARALAGKVGDGFYFARNLLNIDDMPGVAPNGA